MKRLVLIAGSIALVASACAPDPLDTYGAPQAAPDTRAPLPSTTLPADGEAADPVPTFAPNGQSIDVRSLDNSFILATVEIEAGTEVNWINGGRNDHNILPVDESLAWGVERDVFVPGATYAHVFDQPGVFAYYCSIHGTKEVGMIGAVVVEEPS
jgi:plastocyanin